MNQIIILWSFSSIVASISEKFAIKNCYFLAIIFVERSEKLSAKTACDVNVGQVKKGGEFKTVFCDSTWRRNYGGLCGHKAGKNKQFVFKKLQAVVYYNLLIISFSRRTHYCKTDFNVINFLAIYWKSHLGRLYLVFGEGEATKENISIFGFIWLLTLLYDKISSAIDSYELTVGIFIDLSRVFDTVNHQILLDRLAHYGLGGWRSIGLWVTSTYVSNRHQFVQFKDTSFSVHILNAVSLKARN